MAFTYCTSLKTFSVSEDNQAYSLIDGVLFTKDEKTLIKLPPKMDISEYTIPDSTVTVASTAFENCSNLTSVTIPSSVKTIGVYAFYNCSGLASVTIPSSVKAIGDNAFSGCNDIVVYMEAEEPASLGTDAFKLESDDTITASKIVVPSAAVETYKSADGWSKYADIIEPGYPKHGDLNAEFSAMPAAVKVTWDELWTVGTDGVKHYTVYCYPEDGDYENAIQVTYPVTGTVPFTHTFSGLESDAAYNVGVLAEYQSEYTVDYEDIVTTFDNSAVSYIDENGDTRFCADYTVVDSNTTEWSEGWYVVSGDVTVDSSIGALSNINLILTDESKLTVVGDELYGINAGGTLNIYAQSDGDNMGALEAKATSAGSYGVRAKNLNIIGGRVTAEGEYFGMAAENITISGGDISAKSNAVNSVGIYADGNIDITGGAIETTTDDHGYGIYSLCGNITISGGSIKSAGGAGGIIALGKNDNNTLINGGNITISGGVVDAFAEAKGGIGIYAAGTVNIYCNDVSRYPISNPYFTGTINSKTNDGCAIYGSKGITVGNMLAITTPEGGTISTIIDKEETFYAITQSDGRRAANAVIKPLLYSISIEKLTNNTMKIDVPVGRSVNAAYEDFCREFYGTDNFSDFLGRYTAKDGYTFDGFYTESGEKFDFDASVNGDMTITPKWTKKSSGIGGGGVSAYTVKFETNGGNEIESVRIIRNSTVSEPVTPEKDGYSFVGWFTDEELTAAYDFDSKVTKEFTLYAKWAKTDDEHNKNGWGNPFTDVNENDWFYEAVKFVNENGFMSGTSKATFAPNINITRAMLVTVLWRMENEPVVNYLMTFEDVEAEKYYTEAVRWAASEKIVSGYSETEFAPDDNITREQIAAIIYRYAAYKGMEAVTMEENLHFADSGEISEYAVSAINWAVGSGLMKGKTESTINPLDNATRAETAAILQRFIEACK